jgi:hypothetical protein
MFSKKAAPAQDIFTQELTDEQLLQVAGGTCSSSSKSDDDDDDKKKMMHHHHHHHHHHKKMNYTTPMFTIGTTTKINLCTGNQGIRFV